MSVTDYSKQQQHLKKEGAHSKQGRGGETRDSTIQNWIAGREIDLG